MVREAGGEVVGDDLCSGERGIGLPPAAGTPGTGPEGQPAGPWAALAQQYLDLAPCPCRHPSCRERAAHLVGLAAARGARGVALLREKFCEPHRWEDRALLTGLRRHGLAGLELETEAGTVAGERDLTRLQAFLETLEGRTGPGKEG